MSPRTPAAAASLLFGRVTYELMASFWPTPLAAQSNPIVAERMNSLRKCVFSTTLEQVAWNNTTLLKGDVAAEVRKLKQEPGPDIVIMGSGSVVAQLADAGLIDEYQIVLNPIVVGKRPDAVRRRQEKAAAETGEVAGLRQRQCRAVLRAGGVRQD